MQFGVSISRDEDAAYAAAAWASGTKLAELAKQFGVSANAVRRSISRFLDKYDDSDRSPWSVQRAIAAFKAVRAAREAAA